MKYSIMIELDDKLVYVCGDGQTWTDKDLILKYDTYEAALEGAKIWNNPVIVEYDPQTGKGDAIIAKEYGGPEGPERCWRGTVSHRRWRCSSRIWLI